MIFTAQDLFAHENLSFKIIQEYMQKFFRRCILFNPGFILRRFIRGIRTREFFWDLYYALKFYFLPATGNEVKSSYYAQESWPVHDFTSDQKWAKNVCDAITDTGVDIVWTCTNGIRVESADDELFQSLRKSGCYRVAFGFESGNDDVLKSFGKGGRATVEQARKAVQLARGTGIETIGYFMVALFGVS
jgi:hypothetical protein